MSVPIAVLGFARRSPKPGHWFRVVDDRAGSGGLFVLQGWDSADAQGRPVEFDDWVENVERLEQYFEQLPWPVDWSETA